MSFRCHGAFALLALAGLPGEAAEPLRQLVPPPAQFSSAALISSDTQLLIPEPLEGRLLVYGLDGTRLSVFGADPAVRRELRRPVVVERGSSRVNLLDSAWQLLELGSDLAAQRNWRLPGDRSSGARPLVLEADRGPVRDLAVTDFTRFGESWLLAADLKDNAGWRSGVVELNADLGDPVRWLYPLPAGEDPWVLYRTHRLRSLAATSQGAFLLTSQGIARLEQLLPERRTLELPPPFRQTLPLLPLEHFGGSRGFPLLHAKLRSLPFASALHTFRERLYLLTWQPVEAGNLRWQLWRLEADHSWAAPIELDAPPGTREIVVASGASSLALLFRGGLRSAEGSPVLGWRLLRSNELEPPR